VVLLMSIMLNYSDYLNENYEAISDALELSKKVYKNFSDKLF